MESPVKDKKFDLGPRTSNFAQAVRSYIRTLPLNIYTADDIKQVLRSSASIGANYLEAEDALSSKDFLHRIKISRKEAKETIYWLNLLPRETVMSQEDANTLIDEARQLMNIFGKIINNIEQKSKV